MPAPKVEVAAAWMVVVAEPFETESMVVEAPAVNCWSAVQLFALPVLSVTVLVVRVRPVENVRGFS